MTINKSQGQTVEIYLSIHVFSHGRLYVAISRVTSRDGLKMLTMDENVQDANVTSNVVYPKVFRNEGTNNRNFKRACVSW
ncbi:PIF1 helicase, putative [Medicago truncatula]|uniref:PIF1 helicase, putative n=1 Tax=Medicago truncatula TaxID=3880 RepID=A0A072TLF0_MEDTR|nr:PIF1 helicase, putative [Medicago truncatula]